MSIKKASKIIVHDTGRSIISIVVIAALLIGCALFASPIINFFAFDYFYPAVALLSYFGATRVYIVSYVGEDKFIRDDRITCLKLAEMQHNNDCEVVINR